MSWDIFVQDLPAHARKVQEIPDDFVPQPLMSRQALLDGIRHVVPGADFSDPTWGVIDGPDYSIEINIGEGDPVSGFAFHVRGGDLAAGIVSAILEHFGLRAIDTGRDDGMFFDATAAAASLRRWRAYRDRVVARTVERGDRPRQARGDSAT
jgi:hypothetical protein